MHLLPSWLNGKDLKRWPSCAHGLLSPGTHPLHQYQAGVAHIATSVSSFLYQSLFKAVSKSTITLHLQGPLLTLNTSTTVGTHGLSLAFLPTECPSLTVGYGHDEAPLLLWEKLLSVTVDNNLDTDIFLALPPNWQKETTLVEVMDHVLERETLLAVLFQQANVTAHAVSIVLQNWPGHNIAFFMPLLPYLKMVTMQGTSHNPGNYPVIAYPLIPPCTVTNLVLERVIFEDHSLEFMLSPGTHLKSLMLREIINGQIVSLLCHGLLMRC